MQEFETTLKPFILDLLAIIERTQDLAEAESGPDPQAIAHAGQLLNAAFSAFPNPNPEAASAEYLDSFPAALPADERSEEVALDGWLAGDEASFLSEE